MQSAKSVEYFLGMGEIVASKANDGFKKLRPIFFLILNCLSSLLSTSAFVLVKRLESMSSFPIVTGRATIMFIMAITIVYIRKLPLFPPGSKRKMFARAIVGAASNAITYFSVKHMPLGDLAMIKTTSTFFTFIYARIFLKEPISKLNMFNVFVAAGGIVLIVQPPFIFGDVDIYKNDPTALYAMLAMLFSSVVLNSGIYVLLRSLKDIHFATTMTTYSAVAALNGLIFTLALESQNNFAHVLPSTATEWVLLVLIGLLSFAGQTLLTITCKLESAGLVSLSRKATDVICSFAFQILFFKEYPNLYESLGATIIGMVLLVTGSRKVMDEKLPPDNVLKTKYLRLCFLNSQVERDPEDPPIPTSTPAATETVSKKYEQGNTTAEAVR